MNDENLIKKAEKEIEGNLGGGDKGPDEEERKTVVEQLLEILETIGVQLFLDEHSEPHVTIPEKPLVAYPIDSVFFKRYLRRLYWENCQKGLGSEILNQVIGTLEGKAASEDDKKTLYNRIARVGGKIFYDLGDDRQTVEIDNEGWRLSANCPVRFHRFKHQLPQAVPVSGGNWREILKYVNLRDSQSQLLFLTYIPAALIPDIPRVILVCAGLQGSAKSTAMRVARSLIDPSSAELASPARDLIELGQTANHNFCLYLDNMSPLNDELSDALCRLVTGIGFAKRKLYTDDEDILFNQKVAIGLTGINVVAQKPDVLDRCLILNFERINDDERLEEEQFWKQFNEEKPLLLGALFDVLSGVLKHASEIALTRKPRMADYARYAAAAAIVLGETTESFLAAFGENTKRQNSASIESSSTAQVVLEFMSDRDEWEGASSELYGILKQVAEKGNLQIGGAGGFPKAANWLWRKIKEVKPNLQSLGVEVVCEEISANSVIRLWRSSQDAANTATNATESSEVRGGNKDGVAMDTATDETDNPSHEQIDMATVAAIFEEEKCSFCGGNEFWTRQDGERICSVCHPPIVPLPGK
ncbi:hypothetical protein A2630_02635 [Candidatus Woesebacteria bacterium RIFCSPHIGHO2_01_FULL_44_10]|uniref:ATP-binding protein n=1 Tax=Candidatus Woesebacteria bacterium RIFCSPLOWO2_01_FULL_44_14 TaxID=1802525 RepID=A0A1F8C4V8_9BACT|nr:MAG: hypothetical protein A2630_02635 [Candidatus Woesebacteria bacterium RIFCSPHIGHO2_01_FULL_44_10]OGM56136.1 MAG: hypothetical protein A3F62_00705 [Candidatus Woesebacteria bacterium RIFCSPHIGHO2_12_FULL_44_11]OGM70939.1 MAG: hypothetical protein A2975_01550 [Candidatus Woesebacteria bacterium RIFCSPLOWO2_01_FULL_44_14]